MKRALRIHVVVLVALSTTTAISCATSTGETTGGEARFDAAAPLTCPNGTTLLGTGHTWAELYTDYFGNANRTACSGNGACHGDETQAGAQNSNFVCPLNDKDDCYTSMVSESTALIQTSNPANSPLITQVLRHADGSTGNMPLSPPCAFSATDLQRITDWITAGALNDSPVDSGATSPTDAGEASD
jgi:hypothetical protein